MKIYILIFLISTITLAQNNEQPYEYMEEKLVKLALENYPKIKALEHNTEAAIANFKLTRLSWSEQIIGQFNINEATINPSSTQGESNFYPRYLFGLRLTLGNFIRIPLQSKMAKEQVKTSLSEYDMQVQFIKNETKRRYSMYVSKYENFKLRAQALADMQTIYKISTTKFEKGDIKYDEFSKIKSDFLQMQETKNIAEAEYRISKYNVEEMVGVALETID